MEVKMAPPSPEARRSQSKEWHSYLSGSSALLEDMKGGPIFPPVNCFLFPIFWCMMINGIGFYCSSFQLLQHTHSVAVGGKNQTL